MQSGPMLSQHSAAAVEAGVLDLVRGSEHSETQPGSMLPERGSAMQADKPKLLMRFECFPTAGGLVLSESGTAV